MRRGGGECADLLAQVSVVSRLLENAAADFRACIAPERRLRFDSAVSFVLEVRAFSRSPPPSPPLMPYLYLPPSVGSTLAAA